METASALAGVFGVVLAILGGIWKVGAWQAKINVHLQQQDEKMHEMDGKIDQITERLDRQPPPPGGLLRTILGLYSHH